MTKHRGTEVKKHHQQQQHQQQQQQQRSVFITNVASPKRVLSSFLVFCPRVLFSALVFSPYLFQTEPYLFVQDSQLMHHDRGGQCQRIQQDRWDLCVHSQIFQRLCQQCKKNRFCFVPCPT